MGEKKVMATGASESIAMPYFEIQLGNGVVRLHSDVYCFAGTSLLVAGPADNIFTFGETFHRSAKFFYKFVKTQGHPSREILFRSETDPFIEVDEPESREPVEVERGSEPVEDLCV